MKSELILLRSKDLTDGEIKQISKLILRGGMMWKNFQRFNNAHVVLKKKRRRDCRVDVVASRLFRETWGKY